MCFCCYNVVESACLIWCHYSNRAVVITEREPTSLKPFLDPVGVHSLVVVTTLSVNCMSIWLKLKNAFFIGYDFND